jgi:hypothetical protein
MKQATVTILMLSSLGAASVSARPTGPSGVCATYPDAPMCRGAIVACTQCHSAAPEFNTYGAAVAGALASNADYDYDADLPAALRSVESADSDDDGLSNLEEILLGTGPGDALSNFVAPAAPSGDDNVYYDVGSYDLDLALKRLSVTYCGQSPSQAQREALASSSTPTEELHAALDACLSSEYWLTWGLPRLADKKIRPLFELSPQGGTTLADYEWDYRLFVHVLSGDRDARDLLLADYHIDPDGNVVTGVIDSPFGPPEVAGYVGGQPAPPQTRAGMITTQWFLMYHTMFTELPRTTAAQAYRAYLGQDIAKSEGILPVANEPRDIDNKGVAQETCARCHSTLDPLSYGFAYYRGIDLEQGAMGAFDPDRPSWAEADVTSSLLGEPLPNQQQIGVRGWAEKAANTPQFRRATATMFLEQALGRPVMPDEQDELAALEDSMLTDGHVVERLIHRIIDTNAFGVP